MSSDSESDDYYGPALPPGFQKLTPVPDAPNTNSTTTVETKLSSSSETYIGPVLPPELRAKLKEASASSANVETAADMSVESHSIRGKVGDESGDSDSDSDVVGPLPPDHPRALSRSLGPSHSSLTDDKKLKREEWMLVPPKNKIIPGLGLAPRKFLTRAPEDSKQSDDEDDEEAFAREAEAAIEKKLIDDYDQKMDVMKNDFDTKKRRGESLLQIHQKEMKKKKNEKETEKEERKPFDRDTDLQISGISEGDKKKYIEKSKELNTKFSRGSRKYL